MASIESSVINVTLVMDYAANDEYLDENGEYDQPDLMQDDDNYASQTDEDDDDEDDFDRDALPAFANAENRGLNKQLQEQEQKSEALQRLVTENHDRVKIMDEHLKNVKQELTHTQRLVSAKAAEYKTEEHLQRLAENEVSGILLSIRKAEANQEETVDRLNVCQNNIFKGNETLDRFKLQMNWNQEELEQWALAAKQKEEDNLALQKYTRADEAKIRETTQQIEKATLAETDAKVRLEHEVTETQSKQIELDKTAEEFRRLHKERQELVRQWQESIETMRRRDDDIRRAGERYADAKAQLAGTKDRLGQVAKELENIKKDNAETQGGLALKERKVQLLKLEFAGSGGGLNEFKDEAEAIKTQLSKTASELASKRAATAEQRQILEERRAKLEQGRKTYTNLRIKLEKEKKMVRTAFDAASQLEEDLEQLEKSKKIVERQVVKLKEQMFKRSQELFEHRSKEANLIAEISGAQASAKNLNFKIHTLDQESLRQQELVYNAEFQIQQMERKVARAGGERSDEEKIALNARIAEVQVTLDEINEQSRMLKMQCKKVVDELAVSRRSLVDIKIARAKGEAAIAELQLVNDAAVKTLREHNKEKEEFMVRHDVLKLEVKHLRDQLHGHADEGKWFLVVKPGLGGCLFGGLFLTNCSCVFVVYVCFPCSLLFLSVFGLANRKFQLEQSMEERKHEIKVHRDVQRAAHKASSEERHRVAMESKARQSKVKTLKSKYESLVAAARPSDGGGEEKSQAYFIIQAAQKREELQREGDELDGKIRRAEREMKALENTLAHLNDRNTRFRLSFHKADPNSKEAKECRSLESQMKVTKDHLFKKRKELQRLTSDYEEDTRRHRQMERQGQQLQAHLEHLQDAHGQVDNELNDQMDKYNVVLARVDDAAVEHRRTTGVADDYETLEEKKFAAEGLKETNSNVLYTLGQLAREFPEMRDTLQAVLSSQGLDVPSRPPSRISRGSSRASYRTASRGASRGMDQGGL